MFPANLLDQLRKIFVLIGLCRSSKEKSYGIILSKTFTHSGGVYGTKYVIIESEPRILSTVSSGIGYYKRFRKVFNDGIYVATCYIGSKRKYHVAPIESRIPKIIDIDEHILALGASVASISTILINGGLSLYLDYIEDISDDIVTYYAISYSCNIDFEKHELLEISGSDKPTCDIAVRKVRTNKYDYPSREKEIVWSFKSSWYNIFTDKADNEEVEQAISVLRNIIVDENSCLYRLIDYVMDNLYYFIFVYG